MPFSLGNNGQKANYTNKILKKKGTGRVSTDVGTKHRWVMGIDVCLNDVAHAFLRKEKKNK